MAEERVTLGLASVFETLKPTSVPPVARFLQQGRIYSNKARPPKSVTPCEPIGTIFIQTMAGMENTVPVYEGSATTEGLPW